MNHLISKSIAGLVAGLVTQGAWALNPAQTDAATLKIYITGGGAADGNLEQTVKGLLNSVDTYTFAGNRRSFWAVSGTLKPGTSLSPAIPANTTIAFYKRTLGAAFTSTTVATGVQIEHLKVTNAVLTATPNVYNVASGAGSTAFVKSDAGYTDTPIGLFASAVNVPAGVTPPSQAALETLVTLPINAALHGVAVTKGLRDALQQQQGLVVGDESEANIPSLSKSAIASIYRGRISSWDQLVHNGVRLQVPAGYSSDVYVVPRSPGAAIQASVNARILNAPSNPAASGPAAQSLLFAPFVYEPALPADSDTILDGLDKGTAFAWTDGTGSLRNQPAGLRKLALGSQSTERNTGVAPPAASATRDALNYRFIKIDGVAPTVRNAYNGRYPLTLEASIVIPGPTTPGGELSGQKRTFVTELVKRIAEPAVLGANNANFFHGYGQTGYLALSTNGFAVGNFNPLLPVTGYTYGADGATPDIGVPAVLDLGTDEEGNPLAPDLITQ